MTIEEKARAYDKALENAKEWAKNPTIWSSDDICQKLFPELKESEDEMVRKALVEIFSLVKENKKPVVSKEDAELILAWLEKQKDTNALIQEASEKAYTEGMRIERKNWLEKQGDNILIEEIKRRKELYSQEKERAVSSTEKLSLGGRIAVLEELLVFANEKQGEQKTDKYEDYCEGCNNVKGCVTCVDGDQWGHYSDASTVELPNDEDYGIDGLWHAQTILEQTLGTVDGYETDDGILEHKCAISAVKKLRKQKPVESGNMAIMLKRAFGSVGKKTWGGIEVKDILTWLEMQDSQKPTTIWHDVAEIPYLYGEEELLVECKKNGNTWHYITRYDVDVRQFRVLGIPLDDITRWAYVSDILSQSVTKTSEQV